MVPVDSPWLKVKCAPNLFASARIASFCTGRDPQAAIASGACFRDQIPEQGAADATTPHRGFDAEGDLRQRVRGLLRRMQFGGATHRADPEVGYDDGAIMRAFFDIALDEAVIHEAMEAVVAAGAIEPQQMIAQQGQFLWAQDSNDILGRTGDLFVVQA